MRHRTCIRAAVPPVHTRDAWARHDALDGDALRTQPAQHVLVGDGARELLQRDARRERRELTWTDMRNKDKSKIKIESEPKKNFLPSVEPILLPSRPY